MYQASYGVPDSSTASAPEDGEAPETGDVGKGDRVGEGAGNQGDDDSGNTDKENARAANGASQVSDRWVGGGWWVVGSGRGEVGGF